MNYLIVKDGRIDNMIVIQNEDMVKVFDAVPAYDGARIGGAYDPPPLPPTPEDRIALLEETKADRSDVDAITAAIEKGLSL